MSESFDAGDGAQPHGEGPIGPQQSGGMSGAAIALVIAPVGVAMVVVGVLVYAAYQFGFDQGDDSEPISITRGPAIVGTNSGGPELTLET